MSLIRFTQHPDYNYLKSLFRGCLQRHELNEDYDFDWVRTRSRLDLYSAANSPKNREKTKHHHQPQERQAQLQPQPYEQHNDNSNLNIDGVDQNPKQEEENVIDTNSESDQAPATAAVTKALDLNDSTVS